MLKPDFFDVPPIALAKKLLGKILYRYYDGVWLKAKIIETEAYAIHEKGSHSYQGRTPSRAAMFMPPGTIYMYYARGKDSLNVSSSGEGNAVLIKSAIPYGTNADDLSTITRKMKRLNPKRDGGMRSVDNLCSGQTLLCASLAIKVKDWNKKSFNKNEFYIGCVGYHPKAIVQTTRLGISNNRDAHLPHRFIDERYLNFCTKKPKDCKTIIPSTCPA